MSVRVNLILDSEIRSGQPVWVTGLIKALPFAALTVFALGALSFFGSYTALRREVAIAKEAWQQTEPKYLEAVRLKAGIAVEREVLRELKSWGKARIEWSSQLEEMARLMPATIQLTELMIIQRLQMGPKAPERAFELRMSGKTGGLQPEANVTEFQSLFLIHPFFNQTVTNAAIPAGSFKQDPSRNAARTDRVFELVVKYRPRAFE